MGHDQKYVDKKNYEVVGTRFNRPDGIDKVTGKARYGADASAPGQLVGRVLRSPHAHASIVKINVSKAEKLPGVKAIITSADLPDLTGQDQGLADILENCMARGRALYDGHAVAAVAAVDEVAAEGDRPAVPHTGHVEKDPVRLGVPDQAPLLVAVVARALACAQINTWNRVATI